MPRSLLEKMDGVEGVPFVTVRRAGAFSSTGPSSRGGAGYSSDKGRGVPTAEFYNVL